jgi:hypothetical protein
MFPNQNPEFARQHQAARTEAAAQHRLVAEVRSSRPGRVAPLAWFRRHGAEAQVSCGSVAVA